MKIPGLALACWILLSGLSAASPSKIQILALRHLEKILVILLLSSWRLSSAAGAEKGAPSLKPVKRGDQYGFNRRQNRHPPPIRGCKNVRRRLAAVQPDLDGKWGYIDKAGRWFCAPVRPVPEFSEGLAAVIQRPVRLHGPNGQGVIPPRFALDIDNETPPKFSQGRAKVKIAPTWVSSTRPASLSSSPSIIGWAGSPMVWRRCAWNQAAGRDISTRPAPW